MNRTEILDKVKKDKERMAYLKENDNKEYLKSVKNNYKQLACAILLTGLEDADYEFFETDYKKFHDEINRNIPKYKQFSKIQSKEMFNYTRKHCDLISGLAEMEITRNNIPDEFMKLRDFYENHTITDLMELTGFSEDNLRQKARLHRWIIGRNIKEIDIFDL